MADSFDALFGDREMVKAEIKELEAALKEQQRALKSCDKALEQKRKAVNKEVKVVAARVLKGHTFLQNKLPGWTKKVVLRDLMMEDGQVCVLGQLHAKSALRSAGYAINPDSDTRYTEACNVLGLGDGVAFGFDISESYDGCDIPQEASYEVLNHLWERAIRLTKGNRAVTVESLTKDLLF